jgi:hypothetical protein
LDKKPVHQLLIEFITALNNSNSFAFKMKNNKKLLFDVLEVQKNDSRTIDRIKLIERK